MATNGRDLSDILSGFLTGIAKWLFGLGAVAAGVAAGLLVFTCFRVTGTTGVAVADALRNVQTFERILIVGLIGLAVGSTYLYWEEEVLGVLQLILAAALWFTPFYMPLILGETQNEIVARSIDALQNGGAFFGLLSIAVLLFQIVVSVRNRLQHGVKADHLRYGKGVKEDVDRQNVFLGKCWQLPFCRKFVRDRCPIYHARKACWKERVGCMCEEKVIRNALENKPIPKDSLLAANLIPRNFQLTDAQKAERCRNCVIYNEHQKHKYKLVLPLTLLAFVGAYAAFHGSLIAGTLSMIKTADRIVQAGTLGGVQSLGTPTVLVEGLLITFFIVAMSYSIKIVEFLIFKLKI